jgi:hypothetical protein
MNLGDELKTLLADCLEREFDEDRVCSIYQAEYKLRPDSAQEMLAEAADDIRLAMAKNGFTRVHVAVRVCSRVLDVNCCFSSPSPDYIAILAQFQ